MPAFRAAGNSADIRSEISAIEQGFDKLPIMAGNANKLIAVSPGGNSLVADPADYVSLPEISKGSNIAVTATGLQTIPAVGSYFIVTGTGFNITGFNNTYDGRTVTLEMPTGLILVNSASFVLRDASNRRTIAGELVKLVQSASGVWREVVDLNAVDYTGYAGADIPLAIGQQIFYDVSAATTLALRVATATNQEYEIDIACDVIAAINTVASQFLQMNNAALGTSFVTLQNYDNVTTAAHTSTQVTGGNIIIGNSPTPRGMKTRIFTKTAAKAAFSRFMGSNTTAHFEGQMTVFCTDTTTVWTSLGTLNFGNALTGRVTVRRLA